MSRLVSVIAVTGVVAFFASSADAGRGAALRQSVQRMGQRAKSLTRRVGAWGQGALHRVPPIKANVTRAINDVKEQRGQNRLFKDYYKALRAEPLGKGSVRRAYWIESLKRGVPLSASGALAAGTVGVLAGLTAVIELGAGYLGDAMTLAALSGASLWASKRLTQAKRRGKAFARAALVARIAQAKGPVDAALADSLHLALSAYHQSDRARLERIDQQEQGSGVLGALKAGWAKVKRPFAQAKEARSRKALARFEEALSAPAPVE